RNPVIIGGKPMPETYGEFQKEVDMLNKAFIEVMGEGDSKGRTFGFPIPTYNITKDIDWESPVLNDLFEVTAKLGLPYFGNFVNSDMKPDDVRSMCPLDGNEMILTKSSRGRGLEYSKIRLIYEGNMKEEYEIFSDGKFVKGRFNKFSNQKMLKVNLENGHSITLSEEHLNFVRVEEKSKTEVIEAKDFKKGMYLPYSLKTYLGEGGNYDIGYFVGAYAGDGSFDKDTTVVFSLEGERKKDLIVNLKRIAKDYFGANITETQHNKTKLYTLKVHSKAAVGLCRDFVCDKQRDKCYNARLFGMSVEFREGVIAGHYATDGGNRNRIYTSSKKMVQTLNMLAATLGTATSVYTDNREGRLGTEPNYAVLVYQLNWQKYGDFWFKSDNKLWVRIKSIEKRPGNAAYCFEVKDDEPMFTIGTTGILTHNCRLRLDNKELRKRGGGIFAANPLTGSLGVVTLNLPRIAYQTKDEERFIARVLEMMALAKESLDIKRKVVESFTEKGLYPYSRKYLQGVKDMRGKYWANHFNTIGLIGMNEAIMNLFGTNIASKEGRRFALKVLDVMRGELKRYQDQSDDNYNMEATPGDGCTYRMDKLEKAKYPD
ncbi:MAG: anaerobic ribonucleoside-triphosphate reductase, partial [Nanoarchaeota archaeon]